jgi:hypothetical protein
MPISVLAKSCTRPQKRRWFYHRLRCSSYVSKKYLNSSFSLSNLTVYRRYQCPLMRFEEARTIRFPHLRFDVYLNCCYVCLRFPCQRTASASQNLICRHKQQQAHRYGSCNGSGEIKRYTAVEESPYQAGKRRSQQAADALSRRKKAQCRGSVSPARNI